MRQRRAARALLSAVAVVGVCAAGTLRGAPPGDLPELASGDLGSVDLKVDGQDAVEKFGAMNVAAMIPGDATAGVLTVENSGAVPLSYYVVATASNEDGLRLGSALHVKVTNDDTTVSSGLSELCPGEASPSTGDRFTGARLVGVRGDVLSLEPGSSATLCIQARLPKSAATSLQGAMTDVEFTVVGSP